MAKNDISLRIGTKYDGEGFKKLNNALKDSSKQAKTATDTISKISSAVGGIDGEVGKVAGGLSKVFSSFAQGGVVGLAIAGVTTVVGMCISKFKEMREHAKAVAQAIKDNVVNAMKGVLSNAEKVTKEFERQKQMEKRQADKRNNAREVDNSIAANEARQRHIQNRQRLGDDEDAIARDAAEERLELAKLEAQARRESAQARLDAAKKELENEKERLKLIEGERADLAQKHREIYAMESEYVSKMKELLGNRKWNEQNGDKKGMAEIDVAIAELKKKFESSAKNIQGVNEAVMGGLKKWQEQTDRIVAAEVNLEMEAKKMQGAESEYTTAVMSAEEAYKSQISSIDKRKKQEEERARQEAERAKKEADAAQAKIEAERKHQEALEQRAKLEEEKNNAIKESKETEEALEKGIKELADTIKRKEQEIANLQLQNMNDGNRNFDDIRRQRRKEEIAEQKRERQQDKVRQQAEDAVKRKRDEMAGIDGKMRKGNDQNLPWLDKAIKDAIAAGVSPDKLNEILGDNFRDSLQKAREELLDKATKGGKIDESKISQKDKKKLDELDRILDKTEDKKAKAEQAKHDAEKLKDAKDQLKQDIRNSLDDISKRLKNVGL